MRIGDPRRGDGLRNGAEGIEPLRDAPRQALALRLVLHVARGQVDGEAVGLHYFLHDRVVVGGEVPVRSAGPDDGGQLDFVVEGDAAGADDGAGVRGEDRRGGLEEEEGLFGARGRELGYVVARWGGGRVSQCLRYLGQ